MEVKRKINSWSEYEKFKISQDIEEYFLEFVVDLKSKIPSNPSTADLLAVGLILCFFIFFTKSICSKLCEKKKDN